MKHKKKSSSTNKCPPGISHWPHVKTSPKPKVGGQKLMVSWQITSTLTDHKMIIIFFRCCCCCWFFFYIHSSFVILGAVTQLNWIEFNSLICCFISAKKKGRLNLCLICVSRAASSGQFSCVLVMVKHSITNPCYYPILPSILKGWW